MKLSADADVACCLTSAGARTSATGVLGRTIDEARPLSQQNPAKLLICRR
jgi:hypothetical protein